MSKTDNNILYRRIIRSYFSSVISISLVLFLVGFAGLLVVNARAVSNYFKENVTVSAILPIETTVEEAKALIKKMEGYDYIKSVEYISKAEGVMEMKAMLGEDFLDVFEVNPIPISLDFQVEAMYISRDSLSVIEKKLLANPLISDVVYQESLVELLNTNLERLGIVLVILVGMLLLISFVLINNTVRLNIYSKRFTIHTMRLVGATKGFIIRPFMGQAFFQGLIAASIAVLALVGILYTIKREFYQLFMIFEYELLGYVLGAVIILGVFICVLNTMFVVRKLISLTNDDLYY